MTSKSWCLTINNWTPEDWTSVNDFITNNATVGACGREVGESGTPHLQIAFRLRKPCRMAALKERWPRAHIEIMMDKGDKAINYCKKEDPAAFFIDTRRPGKRTDLEDLYETLESGGTLCDVLDTRACLQHIQIAKIYTQIRGDRRPHGPREVLWFWGSTGTGKTRRAYEIDADLLRVTPTAHTSVVWFDGYLSQKTVLLDDLRPDQIKFAKLLVLLDRYTCQEQVKGGMVWANYDRIIVTSPLPPDFWTTDGTDLAQLQRRITTVEFFPEV